MLELEAILAVHHANLLVLEAHEVLVADEVQEAPEVVDLVDQKELQDHRRKELLVEMDNVYYLFLRSQVILAQGYGSRARELLICMFAWVLPIDRNDGYDRIVGRC